MTDKLLSHVSRPHMIAASAGVCMLATALLLSPAESAEARRVTVGPADLSPLATPAQSVEESSRAASLSELMRKSGDGAGHLVANSPGYSTPAYRSSSQQEPNYQGIVQHTRSATADDFIDTVPGPGSLLSPVEVLNAAEPESAPIVAGVSDWRSFQVQSGDSMSRIFNRAGINGSVLKRMLSEVNNSKWTNLYPGEEMDFAFDSGNKFVALQLRRSQLETWIIKEDVHKQFSLEKIVIEPDSMVSYSEGTIKDSLFLDGKAAGLSDRLIMQLVNIFGWDVDFALDIRKNDSFRVMYEKQYLDGKYIADGPILAAEFVNRGKTHSAIRYKSPAGQVGYYTPEGGSVKKAFLRSPVDFARISSHFNLKRKHPILHKIRAHKGTDYAAGRGTPIRSTGEGRVVVAEKQRGYGNVVVVQHGSGITTLYAHMDRFKPGMRVGKKIKQGDVVGYVGSTGLATGPHLHFEFRVDGAPKNPLTVALPSALPVPKKERGTFTTLASGLVSQLHQETNVRQMVMNRNDAESKTEF